MTPPIRRLHHPITGNRIRFQIPLRPCLSATSSFGSFAVSLSLEGIVRELCFPFDAFAKMRYSRRNS